MKKEFIGKYATRISASSLALMASVQVAFFSPVSVFETSAGTNDVIPASFFGLHAMGYGTSPYPVPYQPWGLIRDWDHWGSGNVNWQNLEPSRGVFNWTAMDATVNAVTNLHVNFLHCFGAGPSWAGGNAPTNIADWDLFITNFVTRYHTKIKYLETWNEAAAGEGFYTGTTAMLVQMEHDLYTITKSIDPTVTVLTPDATGGKSVVLNFFNGYFAAGGTNCDAIAFHAYCSETGVGNQICYPEEMIGIVGNLKTAMNTYGQGSKPIFATEGDWGTEGSGANQPTTNDAVAFMAREYLLLWSLGVSSYAWYDWENNNGYWQFGEMWDPNNGGLNAAGVAYQQLYYWMVGAKMSQPYAVQGSVYTCGFTRPDGYQALAVWDTNRASTSTFTVPSGYVQYRDLAGNLNSISGGTVTIGIEPILLENMNEPTFSSLTSHTNTYGAASVTLTGTVSSYGTYPPSGTVITVTINGNEQTTTISDSTGDFSINYNTVGLPDSATPYTVTYSNAAAGSFPAGTDTSTTLTINPTSSNAVTPVFSGLTSHTNTYGDTVTLTGTVSTNGNYLPSGTVVSVTINGLQQNTTIFDSTGDFNVNYNTVGLAVSGSPYTVTYASAATAYYFNAATNVNTTLTLTALPVVLTGSRAYDGTTNAAATILAVSNLVADDNLTLSGSVGLAMADVGVETITSFGSLTLGGTAARNYTLTGASGTVTITATSPNWVITFNSSADVADWVNAGQAVTITPSFANDAPPGQSLSSGSLLFTGIFGPSAAFGGLQTTFASTNLTSYTNFEFDVKVVGAFDQNGQIQALQPTLGITSSLNWDTSTVQPELTIVSTNNGWQHINIPISDFSGDLSDVRRILLLVYDGNYASAQTMQLEFSNIGFTGPGSAKTITPPQIGDLSVNGAQFIFSYPTVLGQTYQLQCTTNLSSDAWFSVGSPVKGIGATIWTTNSDASSIQMFFRLSVSATP